MIAASTAAAFFPSASPAALPSITTRTVSPIPAPTESIVRSAVPRASPDGVIGWTSRSLAPSSFPFLRVETTVPTTFASCMRSPAGSRQIPVIDDADDGGVGGRLGRIEREGGLAAADEEDVLAHTRADRVERHQRPAGRLPGRRERLEDEQGRAGQVRVLDRRDDLPDDPRELHRMSALRARDGDGVHDAHDGGVDRAVLQA